MKHIAFVLGSIMLAVAMVISGTPVVDAASMNGPWGTTVTMGYSECVINFDESNRLYSRSVSISPPGVVGIRMYGNSLRWTATVQWSPDNKTWQDFKRISRTGVIADNGSVLYVQFGPQETISIAVNANRYYFRVLNRVEWLNANGTLVIAMPSAANQGYLEDHQVTLIHYTKVYNTFSTPDTQQFNGFCEV